VWYKQGDRPVHKQPDEWHQVVRYDRLQPGIPLWQATESNNSTGMGLEQIHKGNRRKHRVPERHFPGHWQHLSLRKQKAKQRRHTNKAFFGS